MEIMTPSFRGNMDFFIEQSDVILDHPIYCGHCLLKMKKVNDHAHRCLKCGSTHDEI